MKGGALPLLAWGTVLLVLFAINWVWEGRLIQVGSTTYALLSIYGGALALWLSRREAVRKGAPEPRADAEAVPTASLGAMLVGLSIGCTLFGIVWARFLVYFGLAMLIVSSGRVWLELRAQRRSAARVRREAGP